ncbi:MAG TPA: GspMb/PilO family protein [Pyrinomonadaceae bacterium]
MSSEEVTAPPRIEKRAFTRLIESRRSKMFGPAEAVALVTSCFVLLLVILSYLYLVVPARARLATVKVDQSRVQANVDKLKGLVHEGQNTEQTVDQIMTSLNDFESVSLVKSDEGRMSLYGELNELIIKNGLKNTSGPAYTALEPLGTKVTPGGTSVSTKWQSVYPGIGVVVTIEGPYQNLRHFIQDLERTKQFVIINQVELQRAENSSQIAASAEEGSGTRGSQVSLQLNMAMYFQRDSKVNFAEENANKVQ